MRDVFFGLQAGGGRNFPGPALFARFQDSLVPGHSNSTTEVNKASRYGAVIYHRPDR
jgi:hypothetical protein